MASSGRGRNDAPHAGSRTVCCRTSWRTARRGGVVEGARVPVRCGPCVGRHHGDETALRESLDALQRLGAAPAATIVARRLRARGARNIRRGPYSQTRANPAGLTARQLDVLRLLAQGATDTEIAAQLFVAEKTVSHHVSADPAQARGPQPHGGLGGGDPAGDAVTPGPMRCRVSYPLPNDATDNAVLSRSRHRGGCWWRSWQWLCSGPPLRRSPRAVGTSTGPERVLLPPCPPVQRFAPRRASPSSDGVVRMKRWSRRATSSRPSRTRWEARRSRRASCCGPSLTRGPTQSAPPLASRPRSGAAERPRSLRSQAATKST